jgi:hypothetical protein
MAASRSAQPSVQTNFVLNRMEALQKSMEELMIFFGTMAAEVKTVAKEV